MQALQQKHKKKSPQHSNPRMTIPDMWMKRKKVINLLLSFVVVRSLAKFASIIRLALMQTTSYLACLLLPCFLLTNSFPSEWMDIKLRIVQSLWQKSWLGVELMCHMALFVSWTFKFCKIVLPKEWQTAQIILGGALINLMRKRVNSLRWGVPSK